MSTGTRDTLNLTAGVVETNCCKHREYGPLLCEGAGTNIPIIFSTLFCFGSLSVASTEREKVAVVAAIVKSGLRIMPHSGGRVGKGIYLASENAKRWGALVVCVIHSCGQVLAFILGLSYVGMECRGNISTEAFQQRETPSLCITAQNTPARRSGKGGRG